MFIRLAKKKVSSPIKKRMPTPNVGEAVEQSEVLHITMEKLFIHFLKGYACIYPVIQVFHS